jgi:hypothetical protein
MHAKLWKKWAVLAAGCGVLLQAAPTCVQVAQVVTGWATAITAGSALVLVREILR